MVDFKIQRKIFPFYRQLDSMDCGPTCLRIIAKFYNKDFSIFTLRKFCHITKAGVSLESLKQGLDKMGFKTLVIETDFATLLDKVSYPCILHWDRKHFVVLYDAHKDGFSVSDPAIGRIRYTFREFMSHWQLMPQSDRGRAILIEPTDSFRNKASEKEPRIGLLQAWPMLITHKRKLFISIVTLLFASLFTLLLPFATQAIVDRGISGNDLSIIKLMVLGQLALIIGRLTMDLIRARLLFSIGTEISLSTLTKFLTKLLRLPFLFFDTRNIGDNIQRMQDSQKIEQFFTESLIDILLSIITLLVFSTVLYYYSPSIFAAFLSGAVIMICWVSIHGQQRKILDHKLFRQSSANQLMLIETISAIQEIKLTGSEKQITNQFEHLQRDTNSTKLMSLKLDQKIQNGAQVVNEIKNVITTYLAASLVLSGDITMGMMLSVSFIAGQLNTPLLQFIEFIRMAQNANFSMRRMNEIFLEDEEHADAVNSVIPLSSDPIKMEDISFSYGPPGSKLLFDKLSLTIPFGKTTAIVGMSGSGKTTLLKLLLKFYKPASGRIWLGATNMATLSTGEWRKRCGVVMQDGFIFADSIRNNITLGFDEIDHDRLIYSCEIANIITFIKDLPFEFDTIIGKDGHGLSEGQKQRILIARLVYRNPHYIFMDEATNSLDANNEKAILENLEHFFVGRTVVVVAHRLSTVSNADHIVVLDRGKILEQGSHAELLTTAGPYYRLIKNQLELGK